LLIYYTRIREINALGLLSGQTAKTAVTLRPCGDTALVVEFGDTIDRALSETVLRMRARVHSSALSGVLETVPTFRSLMIHYDPTVTRAADLSRQVLALAQTTDTVTQRRRGWRVPVCYEPDYAPDLAAVAQSTGLAPDAVVSLHLSVRYHVYMIGFLPGFPYMGDLPPQLVLPRREDPRVRIPVGAVAIANSMTGIYPVESPGGWHLIGRTPVPMFDVRAASPSLLAPGDVVDFTPIGTAAYEEILAASKAGEYRLDCSEEAA
jgi:inhibitor of KinA